jgi:hypothetical protein
MKWQTVDLPNGMNLHVWGPISIRHNDITSFHDSLINDLLQQCQAGEAISYCTYEDSAYIVVIDTNVLARHFVEPLSVRDVLENRVLSSCREVIEWDYGDVGTMWALVDYKKILRLRKMPVGDMYLVAMILRNAYVTMFGSNTSSFFEMIPPTLEEWTSQGPR